MNGQRAAARSQQQRNGSVRSAKTGTAATRCLLSGIDDRRPRRGGRRRHSETVLAALKSLGNTST
jgi:hypothetical protein